MLERYEECLRGATRSRKQQWAQATHAQLSAVPEYVSADRLLWLAGRDYYGELLPLTERDGKRSELPLAHMPQGKQRQWLQRQLGSFQ